MNNYYNFNKLSDNNESITFYNSLPNNELNVQLNYEFDNIDFYLNYYADFFKEAFNGLDYDEHYYMMKSLAEWLNDIKIILNILMKRENNEK